MLIVNRFLEEYRQYYLIYALQGVFLVPVHELIHCYAARLLGVPIMLQGSSVYYHDPGFLRNLIITLAPVIFALGLAVWAIASFLYSSHTLSNICVFVIQLSYAFFHLPLCEGDLREAVEILTEKAKGPLV